VAASTAPTAYQPPPLRGSGIAASQIRFPTPASTGPSRLLLTGGGGQGGAPRILYTTAGPGGTVTMARLPPPPPPVQLIRLDTRNLPPAALASVSSLPSVSSLNSLVTARGEMKPSVGQSTSYVSRHQDEQPVRTLPDTSSRRPSLGTASQPVPLSSLPTSVVASEDKSSAKSKNIPSFAVASQSQHSVSERQQRMEPLPPEPSTATVVTPQTSPFKIEGFR
jgi:hypothetical protein